MSSKGRLDLFDSHCHLQDDRIYASRKTVVEEALGRGISRISVNGCCESDWERVTQLGREFPFPTIIPNYGLHPWFLETRSESWLTALRSALVSHPEAGLGECGLDKSPRVLERTPLDVQADLLSQQLKLGKELGRPISLHCVKAWGRMQEVLRAEGPFPSGLVMHSFQGPREVIAPLAKLGAYFSLSLSILGVKEDKARAVVEGVPLERLLLETDSPDGKPRRDFPSSLLSLSPLSISMKVNTPGNLTAVLDVVANLKGLARQVVASHAFANAARVWKLR